ncbi:Spore protein SP21 [Streptomyces lavendulae subsp. lavendulae]|uniref:Spore protein SP21 n=1 Tax=Streptomyces lavendulae subsp. lavendulae TaxID=58340 RepID=A0A2K8PRQ9_STRLA|nr:Spore protein SP21 [Streptomyces lavendulae subsp. lavendulae]QUQ59221.1 Spore protein SP21 [Streptomyces lavendulae subsp. lavendulae]
MRHQVGHYLEQAALTQAGQGWRPLSEEEETEDAYVIKAEMPGIPRENIIVEMHGNDLWITGELDKRSDKVLAQRKGRFCYHARLSGVIDGDKTEATLDRGVLTVHISKSGESKPRRIPITGGYDQFV